MCVELNCVNKDVNEVECCKECIEMFYRNVYGDIEIAGRGSKSNSCSDSKGMQFIHTEKFKVFIFCESFPPPSIHCSKEILHWF